MSAWTSMVSKASKSAIYPSARIMLAAILLAYVPPYLFDVRCGMNLTNQSLSFLDGSLDRWEVCSSDCRGSGILWSCPGYEGAYLPRTWRSAESGTSVKVLMRIHTWFVILMTVCSFVVSLLHSQVHFLDCDELWSLLYLTFPWCSLSFGITYFTMLLQGLVHILHYYT